MIYSYLNLFYNFFLNVSPPPLRKLVFKISLGHLGRGVLIDYSCYFRYPSKIRIGDRVSINRGCQFFPSYHFKDALIILDDDVIIGPSVTFIGAGQDPRSNTLDDIAKTIHVENGAYIGANTTIRYGVTVGAGSIVGAGSMVVGDVPPNTIVAGVPARTLRLR